MPCYAMRCDVGCMRLASATGAQHLSEFRDEHMALAGKLVETCYQMYSRQRTGLAPEFVKFQHGTARASPRAHPHQIT